jgi:hypothetical protein
VPKLQKDQAKRVDAAESTSYETIPDGIYVAELVNVKISAAAGASGHHYWTWELKIADGAHENRRLWYTTSLSPQSEWVLKGAFDAFGFTANSDTDEMIGEKVKAVVGHRTISQGTRTGEIANSVDQLLKYDGADTNDVDDSEVF